ncbi:MAG: hypothetical protein ACI92N_003073, partial [Pseudomonadales bacterium]
MFSAASVLRGYITESEGYNRASAQDEHEQDTNLQGSKICSRQKDCSLPPVLATYPLIYFLLSALR